MPWQQQRHQLGDIHGASAAHPDHALRATGARGIDCSVDHALGGIGQDFVVDLERDAGLAQAVLCGSQKARTANALVRHDEHRLAAETPGEFAHPTRRATCDQRGSRRLEFEVHDASPINLHN